MFDKNIELLMKKIEDEARLIKSDASGEEVQNLIREKLILEKNMKKLEEENQKLRNEIRQYQHENIELQGGLEKILQILHSENISATKTAETVDSSIIETSEDAQKLRRNGLREILRENAQKF